MAPVGGSGHTRSRCDLDTYLEMMRSHPIQNQTAASDSLKGCHECQRKGNPKRTLMTSRNNRLIRNKSNYKLLPDIVIIIYKLSLHMTATSADNRPTLQSLKTINCIMIFILLIVIFCIVLFIVQQNFCRGSVRSQFSLDIDGLSKLFC